MASTVIQNLFATTYKDDYRDSDNYHRILFNSRRALQARELTQMQTIIQSEIARFGRNIFKEGGAVTPGNPTINTNYEFVKLDTTTNTLPTNYNDLVGTYFVGNSSNLKAKVLLVLPAEDSDPATLYVKYVGDASGGASTSLRFTAGEDLSNGTVTLTAQTTNTVSNPAVGRGVQFSSTAGDFFALGHFVFAEQQSIILSKYSNNYTGTVGFVAVEDVVTAADNDALYDNQGDVPNVTAPGADRYRIRLQLTDKVNVANDEMFIFLCEIVNNEIVDQAKGSSTYNEINNLIALRTKEESGNYIARQFKLKFDADSDNGYLIADVSPGVAYVNGYRASINKPVRIRIQKPTTTSIVNNQVVAADYGNYVVANTIVGLPNINVLELWNLKDATGYTGNTIGTARIRSVEQDGSIYKIYLFNINMTGNNSFRSVRSIGVSSTNYANLVLENSIAVLKETNNTSLLFPLPTSRPASLSDISLEVEKRFTATTDVSGNATLGSGLLSANQVWSNISDWLVVIDSSGANVSDTVTITGAGTTTANISGVGAANSNIEVLAYVNISSATVRPKTLTETTITTTVDSDGSGTKFISLGKADVLDVLRVTTVDSDGTDLSSSFRFDNGQRDDYYDVGRLFLRSGRSAPSGNIFVRYRYFTHGAGDFFAVNSYSIDYDQIPSHTLANGTIVSLRDVLDFRPRIDDAGTSFSTSTARVNFLPKHTDLIQADVNYYLPRNDKLVITENAVVNYIPGIPSFNPQFPVTPDNSLDLYTIRMNANTLDQRDLSTTLIENKRYTMSDIARLDKRLTNLEEITTLNLLELSTSTLNVLDSAGVPRTKAGFLADNFADHRFSNVGVGGYAASIDPREKVLRPSVLQRNIRLIYDSDASTNVVKKGDNVYLAYDETTFIVNDDVSEFININPFAVVVNEGVIELSPTSDEWREVEFAPERAVDGGTRLAADNALLFNEWQWNWQGLAANNTNLTGTTLGSNTSTTSSGRTTTTTTVTDRVVSDETIREVIGERVVDVAFIPFMRSRKISFRAYGLIPNQKYWAYFDNTDVNSWVRAETFTRFSDNPEEYGNRYNNATQHPDGPTELSSNGSGIIEGSFFIPNTNSVRFRTGQREFKLLNVSSPVDANATSIARGQYTATGVVETVEQTIQSTRVITVRGETQSQSRTTTSSGGGGGGGGTRPPAPTPVFPPEPPPPPPPPPPPANNGKDPVAQSFFVSDPNGVFVTKARVYFATKPDVGAGDIASPVALELRPMINGHPSAYVGVPGGLVVLTPDQVNIVPDQTQASVLANGTDFVFEEPVYLAPNTEYALCLLSDTTDYNVYVSQTEQYILGSTEKRITRQPLLGSLFKSQNGSTWEPDQTKDLTFQLFKAQFKSGSGVAVFENANIPLNLLTTDPFQLDSGDRWATVYHPYHGFDSGDTVTFYGLDSASTYAGIKGTSILGNRTVAYPDATGYQIYVDSAPTSSQFVGGSNVLSTQNYNYDIINPIAQILVPVGTSVGAQGRFTSGKSYAGSETRFVKDPTPSTIALNSNNVFNSPRMVGNSAVETADIGAKSITTQISINTTSVDVSPVIDLQRMSVGIYNNIIDKQDSDRDAIGFNTPLVFIPETDADGGSHIAKHITTPVTLAENAVGLKILLGANRPSESDFLVYWRTSAGDTPIGNVGWTLVTPENNPPTDENPSVFREYRYLVGGLGGSLAPFTQYQVKIVFRSTNSSRVPLVKDLRIIALAV